MFIQGQAYNIDIKKKSCKNMEVDLIGNFNDQTCNDVLVIFQHKCVFEFHVYNLKTIKSTKLYCRYTNKYWKLVYSTLY